MTRAVRCAGWLVALVLLAPAARAQGAPASAAALAPLAEALEGPAKQAYESAKLLATNRDFEGALAEFKHAYSLSKDPRLLFNMAICDKELRHYAHMRATLEHYLREGANVATPESLVAAQDALQAIRSLVASLKVTANEAGAQVVLDGETVGATPLDAAIPVDLGKHQLTVTKNGFVPFEQTLETPGGTEAVVTVSLAAERHAAQLVVSSEGPATVVVDGRTVGEGRFDGSVTPGAHEVTVSAPGKRSRKIQVDLRDGETRTLQVTLDDEPHGGSAWPWIVGGAVAAAGAAAGGYFLFRPHDQQAAQVPAGKFGGVQLNVWGAR